jgi:tetratricopeptide (TPR) repeat protein
MTPQEAAQQGLKAHQAGRLADAESFYATALKLEPGFYPALHLMGMLDFQRRKFDAAEDWLGKAIMAAPKTAHGPILASRSEVFLELQRWEEALADLDQALSQGPPSAALWNNRGLAQGALKRFDEALESYARAALLSPGSGEIYNNRGDALRELRRFDQALVSFERALTLNPADWRALNNRATTLSQMGRFEDAIACYSQALAVNPDIPASLYARGNLYWSKKAMLAPALADLDRLAAVAPDAPAARGGLEGR